MINHSNHKKEQLENIFPNYLLVSDQTFINSTIDYTLSGINGDIDNQQKILFNCVGGSIDSQNNNAYIRLNNDNTTGHYINPRVLGGYSGSSDVFVGDTNYGTTGMFIGEIRVNTNLFVEMKLDSKTGKNRQAHITESIQRGNETYIQIFSPTQFNTSSIITSFVFYCPQTIPSSRIRVYKYQDI